MKRNVKESVVIISDQNVGISVDNMCSAWGSISYPELSVLMVYLKFLATVHQTHHWTAMGDPFYGDHLLFERLYGAIGDEIDAVAEKSIGLGSIDNVNISLQTSQLMSLVDDYGVVQTIPQSTELSKRSLMAEMKFLAAANALVQSMSERGALTKGVDNLIAGIIDKHEGHVYLLKQRCTL